VVLLIKFEIPGVKTIQAEHLVLDYNGTLAVDGTLISGACEMLNGLSEKINIYVITADTFGKAAQNLKNVKCSLKVISGNDQTQQKNEFIHSLGKDSVIAVGNGANDALMLKNSAIGIALIQKEGACANTVFSADIVCTSIIDALELLNNPLRITATLRI
jgi:P-type E1-E2 ATPase